MKIWRIEIQYRIAQFKRWIYEILGLEHYDMCDLCLKMFDTRQGYGDWNDVTSCLPCGPTEEELAESARLREDI